MNIQGAPGEKTPEEVSEHDKEFEELLPLLRLLLEEPPPGHDFATCPICRRWGITHL